MKNIQTGDNILKKNKNSYTGNVSCSDCGCKCADVVCRKSTCTDRSAKRKKPETKRFAAIMMLQKTSITSGAHQDLTE